MLLLYSDEIHVGSYKVRDFATLFFWGGDADGFCGDSFRDS